MMRKTIVLLLFASAALLPAQAQDKGKYWEDRDLPERDEFQQTYQLSPGARVLLSSLNCGVKVETSAGSTAEVQIVRSARTREALEYQKIIVEHTANSLTIRGEDESGRGRRGRDSEVRQRITLRIPRQVEFEARGINGSVSGGEIDGPVRLGGINGMVKLDQALGHVDISGINGRVVMNIARLGEQGIRVDGVNGGVELRFSDDLNADLEVSGCNGSVHADVPNVTLQGKISRDNFRARIGSGGTRITVTGVNGRVRLTRAGSVG